MQLQVLTKLNPKMPILEALYIRQCTDVLTGLLAEHDEPRKSPVFDPYCQFQTQNMVYHLLRSTFRGGATKPGS